MRMEQQPSEDVSPIKNGDFTLTRQFLGVYFLDLLGHDAKRNSDPKIISTWWFLHGDFHSMGSQSAKNQQQEQIQAKESIWPL